MEQERSFPDVFCNAGDASVSLSCQLYSCVMLCTCCLNSEMIEHVIAVLVVVAFIFIIFIIISEGSDK